MFRLQLWPGGWVLSLQICGPSVRLGQAVVRGRRLLHRVAPWGLVKQLVCAVPDSGHGPDTDEASTRFPPGNNGQAGITPYTQARFADIMPALVSTQ